MTSEPDRRRSHHLALGMLLGLAIGGPVVLGNSGVAPAWAGAAVAGVGLLGALVVLSSQGALKVRYIALLVGAILAAALTGSFWL